MYVIWQHIKATFLLVQIKYVSFNIVLLDMVLVDSQMTTSHLREYVGQMVASSFYHVLPIFMLFLNGHYHIIKFFLMITWT